MRRAAAPWIVVGFSVGCSRPAKSVEGDSGPALVAASVPSGPGSASSSPPPPKVPTHLTGTYGIVVVPAEPRTTPVVYLHGMWASPEDSCSYFEAAAATYGPLVCPRGNLSKQAGGAFGGSLAEQRKSLDAALATVKVGDRGVLLGFSSGAAFALRLSLAEPGRWPALVLMSMPLSPTATALKTAGVERVVFAAGENDGSYAHLVALTATLAKGGVTTRFVSLGKVGHHFAVDMEARMVDALAWVTSK